MVAETLDKEENEMRLSLTSLVKMIAIMGVLACVGAIGLSRMVPPVTHFRIKAPAIYSPLNNGTMAAAGAKLNFLDISNGDLCSVKLPDGNALDYASSSHWVDERGEYQVAGRWTKYGRSGECWVVEDVGIARMAMPSGRLINQSSVDPVPASRPCWYPGTASRVLYAVGNGGLYQVDFNAGGSGHEDDLEFAVDDYANPTTAGVARPIPWTCELPGSQLMIMDPFWSNDPRLGGRLIASVSYWNGNPAKSLVPSRLWWLKLNAEGTEIVAAEPLEKEGAPEGSGARAGQARYPAIATKASGELTLAYLWQDLESRGTWELRLESLGFDSKTREPRVNAGLPKRIASEHLPVVPQFSLDGGSIYGILRGEGTLAKTAGLVGKVVKYSADPSTMEPLPTLAGLAIRKE